MEANFMQRLGDAVKLRRNQLGMTQLQLGEKIGRPQSSIARLEAAQLGDAHFGFIFDISKALDTPAEMLVAYALGREFNLEGSEKTTVSKNNVLDAIKVRMDNLDSSAKRVVIDLFSELTAWITEVPKVPEGKK